MKLRLPTPLLALALTGALALPPLALAQTPTVPVGYVSVTIGAGTGAARRISPLSLPLYGSANAEGQMVGQITGFTSNTLSNADAAWAPGQLAQAATPYLIKLTSGAAAGRTFLISTTAANTSTTVTIDAADLVPGALTAVGIALGDQYEILPCDTFLSFFGTPEESAILGGASAATADTVTMVTNEATETFFYSTTLNRWTKSFIGSPDASNTPLRPDSGLYYNRLANTSLSLVVAGQVSTTNRQTPVRNTGVTQLAQNWPVSLTLGNSGIQALPSWGSALAATSADKVKLTVNGATSTYWFDGTNWRKQMLGSPISNAVILPAGSTVTLEKSGGASGYNTLTQPLPYTLP